MENILHTVGIQLQLWSNDYYTRFIFPEFILFSRSIEVQGGCLKSYKWSGLPGKPLDNNNKSSLSTLYTRGNYSFLIVFAEFIIFLETAGQVSPWMFHFS